jgi:osmotically-inducible protein OsmY
MRSLSTLVLLAAIAFLHGCAAVAIGGAAAGGYMLGEERRPPPVLADDQAIEFKVANQIHEKFVGSHVNTTSYNRMVLLTGEVQGAEMKAAVEKIARATENVRGVYNELTIGPVTPLSARTNDSLITGKVKARFVDAGKFHPLHVKVVTEAGTVYLMGLVNRQEANDATEIARTTSGVQRVVRVFEIQE